MMLRRDGRLGVLLMLGGVVCGACGREPAAPASPAVTDVFTPAIAFSPPSVHIVRGGIVRFNIFGDEHNVIFASGLAGAPANIEIVQNAVVQRIFTTAGTFPYTCTVHPGMNGEIIVE